MRIGLVAATMVIAVMGLAPCSAQTVGGPSPSVPSGGGTMGRDLIGQETFNKLNEAAINAKRLTKDDKAMGKTLEQVLEEDRKAAAELAKALPVPCTVVNAMRFAEGPETVDGQTVQTRTYEAVCGNGMGYFLISLEPGTPRGLSCFAVADHAKADKKVEICRLPGNSDLKLSAGKMLASAGVTGCTVKDVLWRGQNAASHVEFDEVACEGGQGYMMLVPLPGAQFPVQARTCNKSATGGLPCNLSDNGVVTNSPQAFRDALAKHKIACDATDETTRIIGKQANVKRYVVEFACSQHPGGLVVFIPVEDSTAPFEVMDCAGSAKKGAVCALPQNKK